MTDAERTAIHEMIERHTAAAVATKQTAREALIKEGIYDTSGALTPEYGGPKLSNRKSAQGR